MTDATKQHALELAELRAALASIERENVGLRGEVHALKAQLTGYMHGEACQREAQAQQALAALKSMQAQAPKDGPCPA